MMRLIKIPIAQAIPADLVELWEERAAIMQHEGGLSPEDAEWQARLFVCGEVEAMPVAYSEVSPYDP